jgi:cyclopropane-fatty-acyl-phospholipid synthase
MTRATAAGSMPRGEPRAGGWLDRQLRVRLVGALEGLAHGSLELVEGDERRLFGVRGSGPHVSVTIHDPVVFRRTLRHGDVGLGEAYVDGQWDADDLAELITLVHLNAEIFDAPALAGGRISRLVNRLGHLARRNTRAGSRSNIGRHYDLGDDLFSTFLDRSMSYSCAIFGGPDDTLERAQQRKMSRILDKARLQSGQRVLEIGCGWGSLSLQAAREYGCRVTGITVSDNQLAAARRRASSAGLENLVSFELCDYRDVRGSYDRVLSVEMLEAVGHEYLERYFGTIDRVLASGGIAVLQVITFPDQRYDDYRRGCDWLQKYIFPGGIAPSLTAICHALTRGSRLMVESVENIGPHYARTLREWRNRFESRAEQLEKRGYDARFRRLWSYYLAYCEGGFAARTFNDLQLVLTRANNVSLMPSGGAS